MELILASTSIYRKRLLERLKIQFQISAPNFDEDTVKAEALDPVALSQVLAEGKCDSVVRMFPNAIVIGCDQVVDLDGQILGKSKDRKEAMAQLRRLSGKTHRLLTSLCVKKSGMTLSHTDETQIQMRSLADNEIEYYVDMEKPFDCAGSYKIESLGPYILDSVRTSDPSAIEGLPLMALVKILKTFRFPLEQKT